MTTIAAPPRRVRSTTRGAVRAAPARARRDVPARAKAVPRAAARTLNIGKLGALLALVTVFALVTAVVFHVFLAQNQLELDTLGKQIAKEQRLYEQKRLTTSLMASPSRIIQEAQRLGLIVPEAPATYLPVEGAPMPQVNDGSTTETITDWTKTKPSLGPQQP